MNKIKVLDFAKNVESNRVKLINHCIENNVPASMNDSLDAVVAKTSTIQVSKSDSLIEIEFFDIDGSYFAPSKYVERGDSVDFPAEIPNYDSEYLEFLEWRTSCDDTLDNIQDDIQCVAFYQTKYIESLGQRPTHIIGYFEQSTLSPTIYFTEIPKNTFVDWGDGTEHTSVTSKSINHTYNAEGQYTITVYGDSYSLGDTGTIFRGDYRNAISKIYFGENIATKNLTYQCQYFKNLQCVIMPDNTNIQLPAQGQFEGCSALKCFVVPKGTTTRGFESSFRSCSGLKVVIMPSGIVDFAGYAFYGCNNLKKFFMPSTVEKMGTESFSSCYALEKIRLSQNVYTLGNNTFYGCNKLKTATLPARLSNIPSYTFQASIGGYGLNQFIITDNILQIDSYAFSNSAVKNLTIPASVRKMDPYALYNMGTLEELTIYPDFEISGLRLNTSRLSDKSLAGIFSNLKDLTGQTAGTISFGKFYVPMMRLKEIYINELGDIVTKDSHGAISLIDIAINKNWTISLI